MKAEKETKNPLDEALGPLAGKGAEDEGAEGDSGVTPEELDAFKEFEGAPDAESRALALKNFIYACQGG